MRKRVCSIPLFSSVFCGCLLFAPLAALAGDEIFGPQVCLRGSGAPSVYQYSFSTAEPGRGYVLKVYNGGLEDTLYEQVSSSVITLNGVEILGPANFNQFVSYLEVPVALQAQNTLHVEVRGKPGGALVLKLYPFVVLDDPTAGQAVSAAAVRVTGRLFGAATGVSVNGTSATLSGTGFSVDGVPLAEGSNILTATAFGAGSVLGRASVSVLRDTVPPAITMTSPLDGAVVATPSVNLAGSVDDPAATVIINGSAVPLVDASFFVQGYVLQPGVNVISIEARDPPGNGATLALHVTYAPPPPPAVLSVSPGEISEGGSTLLQWYTSGATAVTITPGVGSVSASGSMTISPAASTTYLLTAVGPGGATTAGANVVVLPSLPPGCPGCPPGWYWPPTASLTVVPLTGSEGAGATLVWASTDASTCSISNGIGAVPCSGSLAVSPTETTAFTLTAVGPGGVANATAVVTAGCAAPTATISAEPSSILRGAVSILSWNSASAITCSLAGVGPVDCNGTLSVTPMVTTHYALQANGPCGAAEATVAVDVAQPPPTAGLSADPPSLVRGGSATLSWVSADADVCSIAGVGPVNCSGTLVVQPEATTTYILSASGPGGSVSASTAVGVTHPAPTAILSAAPSSIVRGSATVLTWISSDADQCSLVGVGAVDCTGSMPVLPEVTTTYTLLVSGPGGEAAASETVTVAPRPPAASLTVEPVTVVQGSAATLSWTSTDAETCVIEGVGTVACSGSTSVAPQTSKTYTLTAVGPGGEALSSVTLAVTYAAPTVALALAPAAIPAGGAATLSWQSTGAVSASIDHGIGSVPVNGSITVSPTESTTYLITVAGAGGTAAATAGVVVTAPCADGDGDLYSAAGGECGPIDCADNDSATHPGAAEIAGDGIDQDCDGADLSPFLVDADHDLFGPFQGDCNDNDPSIFPGATDFPHNGIDEDCDGRDAIAPPLADRDLDGFAAAGGDCDDTNPSAHPGAAEVPCNGIDDDCDGADLCEVAPAETERSGFIHGEVCDARTKSPIAGAEVLVANVGRLLTDGQGKFVFPTPDQGIYLLLVRRPGYTYAQRRVAVRPTAHVAAEPVFLVPLDAATAAIGPGSGGTLTSSAGDVELYFEPGAVSETIVVSATRFLEPEELPGALPETSHFTMAVDLRPDGVTFNKPVRFRVENTHGFAPATPVPVGYYRKDLGSWVPDGMAKVTGDGKWVEYWPTHFTPFDCNLAVVPTVTLLDRVQPPEAATEQSDESNVPRLGCQAGNSDNCRVVYHSGNLMEDYALPAYRSLGRSTAVRLVYASDTANPKAVISTNYDLNSTDTTVPETVELKVAVAGRTISTHFSGAEGSTRQAYLLDAKDSAGHYLQTGAYPYQVSLSNWYPVYYALAGYFGGPPLVLVRDSSGSPVRAPWTAPFGRRFAGRVIINNKVDSPIGSGWSVDGISRLYQSAFEGTVLVEGDGAKRYYSGNIIGTVAGKQFGFSGDGGPAADAALAGPAGICTDGRGNLFVADGENYRVRKIGADGVISTVAGNGQRGYSGDGGSAREARIGYPLGVAVDAVGNLYIADVDNNRIRKVSPAGIITTFAGSGETAFNGEGVPALEAGISFPYGVAVDKAGNVYYSEAGTSRVRRIDSRGIVTTVAGNGENGFSGDGGSAVQASLGGPTMIVIGDRGVIYVADYGNRRVRRIDTDGTIETVAGNGDGTEGVSGAVSGDGGLAVEAALGRPMSLALDRTGNLYIGISEGRVRKVDERGMISTVAGNGVRANGPDGVPATQSSVYGVCGLAFDRLGTMYTSDYSRIRRIDPGIPSAGDVALASPTGDSSTLKRLADGTSALREKDGTTTYFDAKGLQTRKTDANGNATSYAYDERDRIVSIIDPVGQPALFHYSGERLSAISDPAGRMTTIAHDGAGNLTTVTGPDGAETQFSYDSNHMLTAKKTPCCTTVYNSDGHGFIASVVSPDGSVREYSPGNARDFINDLPAGVGTRQNPAPATYQREDVYKNPFGHATRMVTDKNGRLLSETDPFGNMTTYARNDAGLPTGVGYPDGTGRSLSYDAKGNLLSETDAYGNTVSFTYEPLFENVASVTDALGNVTVMAYDAHGNASEITLANGFSTTMTYDGRGLLVGAANALGLTAFSHDARGNVASVVDPVGNATSLERDSAGNVTAVVDPEGKRTQYAYDLRNRMTSATDSLGQTTLFAHDELNLRTVTDARGKQTRYEYNAAGYLSKESDPLGYQTTYVYGPGGVVQTVTDPVGRATTYGYDPVGRLVDKTYSDGTAVHYGYDARGNLVVADNGFSRISFEYDGNGRLTKATASPTSYQAGGSVSYAYDANGNRLAMTDTAGGVTAYAYDAMNLLVSLTNPLGQTTHYAYDAAGRLVSRTFANGMYESIARDASGNLSALKIGRPGQADMVLEQHYERNGSGVITALHAEDGIHGYAYDGAYRLVQADHPSQAQEQYSYDAVGNRLDSHAANNWLFDDGNQLLGNERLDLSYDEDGNLASKTEAGGTTAYSYDYENRLVRIDHPDGRFSAYAYDPLGRRIWTNENGLITKFVYDGANVLAEYEDDGSPRARYTFGPGLDEMLSAEVPGRSGSIFYLTDHLGSVRWLADAQGNLIAGYRYDSFGNVVEKSGNVYNPFGYAGRVLDEASGLMYYRARYYDPSVGRFTTKDPIGFAGGDTNLYAYVGNDPVNLVDPLGLWGEDVHYGMTYSWAVAAGLTTSQAERIARADNGTDGGFGSWMPILGDQSRHFNQGGTCADSRSSWAETEFRRAVGYYDQGNMNAALGHLGRGLHSLQDIDPHRDWDTGTLGWSAHPGWYDSWNDPRNSAARAVTEQTSLKYLRRFLSVVSPR